MSAELQFARSSALVTGSLPQTCLDCMRYRESPRHRSVSVCPSYAATAPPMSQSTPSCHHPLTPGGCRLWVVPPGSHHRRPGWCCSAPQPPAPAPRRTCVPPGRVLHSMNSAAMGSSRLPPLCTDPPVLVSCALAPAFSALRVANAWTVGSSRPSATWRALRGRPATGCAASRAKRPGQTTSKPGTDGDGRRSLRRHAPPNARQRDDSDKKRTKRKDNHGHKRRK